MDAQPKRTPRSRPKRATADELGAHVSTAGGVVLAPARAAALKARVLQLFTKQPGRWADRSFDEATCAAFAAEVRAHGIEALAAHDAYLINLASPDPFLFARSFDAFLGELRRCAELSLHYLVTHPGNAMTGEVASAIARNAEAIEGALEASSFRGMVLLETTAGTGSALGASFDELAALIDRVGPTQRPRLGVCMDTCHVWAAGYDIRHEYDAVMARFADTVGIERLRFFHLNDSLFGCGSRRDRHAHIGRGALGDAAFRSLLEDERFAHVPKVLETPKDDDALRADRRNLRRLRGYRRGTAGNRTAHG
jgi:deoxyribonuclease IV